MPRKPRVEYCGAFYHVITRGNQRQNLFHNNQDREFYLDRLEQYRKRYGFTIYAYEAKTLVEAGRQRRWVRTRSMLVYMAREYCGITVKELGKRLNRDPSIISRLYSAYAGSRDSAAESRLLRKIGQ